MNYIFIINRNITPSVPFPADLGDVLIVYSTSTPEATAAIKITAIIVIVVTSM